MLTLSTDCTHNCAGGSDSKCPTAESACIHNQDPAGRGRGSTQRPGVPGRHKQPRIRAASSTCCNKRKKSVLHWLGPSQDRTSLDQQKCPRAWPLSTTRQATTEGGWHDQVLVLNRFPQVNSWEPKKDQKI